MKYEFIKKDVDTTILKYKDKEFEIKRDISLQSLVQGVHSRARRKMYIELTKEGMTKDDLIIKKTEGSKIFEDNSNLTALENSYIEEETLNLMNDICNKYFNMLFTDLIIDVGLDTENFKEVEKFTTDLTLSIKGEDKTPSQKQ